MIEAFFFESCDECAQFFAARLGRSAIDGSVRRSFIVSGNQLPLETRVSAAWSSYIIILRKPQGKLLCAASPRELEIFVCAVRTFGVSALASSSCSWVG